MAAIRIIDDHTELSNVGTITHAQIETALSARLEDLIDDVTPQLGGNLDMQTYKIVGEGGSTGIYIDSAGNLGVGGTTPDEKLTVDYGHLRFNRVVRPGTGVTLGVSAGGVLTGTYKYRITYITANGETNVGSYSSSISPSGEKIELTNIPISGDSKVTGRKIYRTVANDVYPYLGKLVTTIDDNTTTVYQDNTADGSLGVYAPGNNTTGGQINENSELAMEMNEETTIIGAQAGANNSSIRNAFIGSNAGYLNTTGYNNSAMGYQALYSNTSGYNNSTIGYQALYSNTIGYNNSAIGRYALYLNTSGFQNSAMGYVALYDNTTGSNNSAIGYYAGRFIANGSTANTTGDYNVFIGSNSKALADNDQNEIVIGYNTVGVGSNTVVLGNDDITKTILKGDVGLGTTTPTAKLDVNSDIVRVRTSKTPATAGANGNAGDICWDADYIYVCVATNTWKRSAISTW